MPNTTRTIGVLFILIGAALLVIYTSEYALASYYEDWPTFIDDDTKGDGGTVLVIGAGAIFLGIYSAAMSTERYVKADVLLAGYVPLLENLDRMLGELEVTGNAVYLPENYAGEPRTFIPTRPGNTAISIPDLRGDPTFLTAASTTQQGILIAPPGHMLCDLVEEEIEARLEDLEPAATATMIPPLISNGYGLAGPIQIDEENLTISIQNPITTILYTEENRATAQTGCPIAACLIESLTRSKNQALRILELTHEPGTGIVKITLEEVEG